MAFLTRSLSDRRTFPLTFRSCSQLPFTRTPPRGSEEIHSYTYSQRCPSSLQPPPCQTGASGDTGFIHSARSCWSLFPALHHHSMVLMSGLHHPNIWRASAQGKSNQNTPGMDADMQGKAAETVCKLLEVCFACLWIMNSSCLNITLRITESLFLCIYLLVSVYVCTCGWVWVWGQRSTLSVTPLEPSSLIFKIGSLADNQAPGVCLSLVP